MICRIVVPPDATRPGQLLHFRLYDGTDGYVPIPPGFGPGDQFEFEMEVDDEDGVRELARRKELFLPLVPKRKGKEERLSGTGTKKGKRGTKSHCCERWYCPKRFIDLIIEKFDPSKTPVAAVLLRLALLPITSYCVGYTLRNGPFALIDIDAVANPTYFNVMAAMCDAKVAVVVAAGIPAALTFMLGLCELVEMFLLAWRGQRDRASGGGERGKPKRAAGKKNIPVANLVRERRTGTKMPPCRVLPLVSSLSDHLPPEILGIVSRYLDVHDLTDVNSLICCSVRAGAADFECDDIARIIRRSYLRRNFHYLSFLWRREYEMKYKGVRAWMDANPDWKQMYTRPYCKAFRFDHTDHTLHDKSEAKHDGDEDDFTNDTLPDWEADADADGDADEVREESVDGADVNFDSEEGVDDGNADSDEGSTVGDAHAGGRFSSSSPFFSPPRHHADGRLVDFDRFDFDCVFDDIRGAVSFGLTEVLRYLVEERGANVNELYELYPEKNSDGGYADSGNVDDGDNGDEDEEDGDDDGSIYVGRRRPPLFYALINSREAPFPPTTLGPLDDLDDRTLSRQVSPLEYLLSLPSLNVNWSWINDAGYYWNLFQFAACSGQVSPSNLSLLLRHGGIDVNAQPSPCRRSALHDACMYLENAGSAEKVGLLLNAGADPNIVDGRGCTPWRRMLDENDSEKDSKFCKEIAALLRDAGGIDPKGGN